ncbi:restriction endonuclease subunit S [Mesomycoplasma conjunctivae]|uniref:restriction endonuclease subunit S n=1 Tax=Mesomycoplasma conjunctivae TaxID=45361 RepID=UPI00101DF8C6|nr:restriction endonuclease subunit S [Mesomycoplasma conjunctivae]
MVEHHTSNLTFSDAKKQGKYFLYDAKEIIGKTDKFVIKENYISIIKDGDAGRLRFLPTNTAFCSTMSALTSKNNFDIYFIYSLLSSYFPIESIISGTTIKHIYFKNYGQFEYFVPSIKEQEKIAKVFKNIDNLLNLYELKLQKIEMIKTTLLNKMFV